MNRLDTAQPAAPIAPACIECLPVALDAATYALTDGQFIYDTSDSGMVNYAEVNRDIKQADVLTASGKRASWFRVTEAERARPVAGIIERALLLNSIGLAIDAACEERKRVAAYNEACTTLQNAMLKILSIHVPQQLLVPQLSSFEMDSHSERNRVRVTHAGYVFAAHRHGQSLHVTGEQNFWNRVEQEDAKANFGPTSFQALSAKAADWHIVASIEGLGFSLHQERVADAKAATGSESGAESGAESED